MGQHYTKPKDTKEDEKTMNATEFIDRMFSKAPAKIKKVETTESSK